MGMKNTGQQKSLLNFVSQIIILLSSVMTVVDSVTYVENTDDEFFENGS